MRQVLEAFTGDPKVQAAAILVLLDIFLGVIASIKSHTFSWGRVADFLRDDILYKLLPYYGIWAATYVGGDLVIPGVDIGAISAAAYLAVVAAMAYSIFKSLQELGLGDRSSPSQ